MPLALFLLQLAAADTLPIRVINRPPPPGSRIDSVGLGLPQVRIPTGQGTALVWLLRAQDTVFVLASIPDSTPYWGDDFVISLDTRGDGAPAPQHDDFQLYFRRRLDSSVVYRGRNGRWEPPRGDPDWRLGRERAGGGWEVSARDDSAQWSLLLRLDPAWFAGEAERLPRVAFRIYDDAPSGWYSYPAARGKAPAASVEQAPVLWAVVKSD
ncbi:MAG TPA: hypothetical protein VFH26_06895 [Gemmatimonadales bacterium]|nr:hypothetical protein [Gemmatimonadales bacterium]